MKAMIFAAGLGSRLKPLTDTMPKALVPIAGRPMLEHVILKLKAAGFTEIMINIHHFGEQILDFLKANENFGLIIHISDERDLLLDTGGGVKKARSFFENSDEPFLIHNVDILSDVNLKELYDYHLQSGAVATLLASQRKTSRYLLFDTDKRLCGWINKDTEQVKPGSSVVMTTHNLQLLKEYPGRVYRCADHQIVDVTAEYMPRQRTIEIDLNIDN